MHSCATASRAGIATWGASCRVPVPRSLRNAGSRRGGARCRPLRPRVVRCADRGQPAVRVILSLTRRGPRRQGERQDDQRAQGGRACHGEGLTLARHRVNASRPVCSSMRALSTRRDARVAACPPSPKRRPMPSTGSSRPGYRGRACRRWRTPPSAAPASPNFARDPPAVAARCSPPIASTSALSVSSTFGIQKSTPWPLATYACCALQLIVVQPWSPAGLEMEHFQTVASARSIACWRGRGICQPRPRQSMTSHQRSISMRVIAWTQRRHRQYSRRFAKYHMTRVQLVIGIQQFRVRRRPRTRELGGGRCLRCLRMT